MDTPNRTNAVEHTSQSMENQVLSNRFLGNLDWLINKATFAFGANAEIENISRQQPFDPRVQAQARFLIHGDREAEITSFLSVRANDHAVKISIGVPNFFGTKETKYTTSIKKPPELVNPDDIRKAFMDLKAYLGVLGKENRALLARQKQDRRSPSPQPPAPSP